MSLLWFANPTKVGKNYGQATIYHAIFDGSYLPFMVLLWMVSCSSNAHYSLLIPRYTGRCFCLVKLATNHEASVRAPSPTRVTQTGFVPRSDGDFSRDFMGTLLVNTMH